MLKKKVHKYTRNGRWEEEFLLKRWKSIKPRKIIKIQEHHADKQIPWGQTRTCFCVEVHIPSMKKEGVLR